jgi:hypothetical protein
MKPDTPRCFCTVLAAVLSLTIGGVLLPTLHAADPPTEPYTTADLLPGGIVDADGKTAYLQGKDGTLAAVDLEKGTDLWKTDASLTPLGFWGRRLVTAAAVKDKPDQIRLVVLDLAKDGKKLSESDPIDISGFRKGLHGNVLVRGYLDGDDLLLQWTAIWTTDTRQPNELPEYSRGLTRVNLKSGKAASLTEKETNALRPPLKLSAKLEEVLSKKPGPTTQFLNEGAWSSEPRRLFAGNRVGAIHRTQVEKEEKVILQTWDLRTGEDADTTVLLQRSFGLHFKETLDGRYVAFELTPPNAQPDKQSDAAYWDVFGVADKKRVGKVLFGWNSLGLGVSESRAFVLQSELNKDERNLVLKASDLRTEKLLWQRPSAGLGQFVKLSD